MSLSDLQRLPQYTMIILRQRKMPFKTKMTPAWKMDKENAWGKSYPKATYPKREKEPVRTFDLKKFVTEKRDKKISELLGNDMPKGPSMNPFMGNPGMPVGNIFDGAPKGGLNVDDLVKRIDAKIAELEAEEAAEKAKQAKNIDKKDTSINDKSQDVKQVEEKKFRRDEITDDQFFDDFFNDEDDE